MFTHSSGKSSTGITTSESYHGNCFDGLSDNGSKLANLTSAIKGSAGSTALQASMETTAPDEPAEIEAEKKADQVMRSMDSTAGTTITNDKKNEPARTIDEKKNTVAKSADSSAQEKNTSVVSRSSNNTKKENVNTLTRAIENKDPDKVSRLPENKETSGNDSQKVAKKIESKSDKNESHHLLAKKNDTNERKVSKEADGTSSTSVSSSAENAINTARGSGTSLSDSVRSSMEPHYNADFSSVRIHNSPDAHSVSKDLNAKAFTVGNDIFFSENRYNPDSSEGRHLLAHELTHVVQQTNAVQKKVAKENDPPSAGSAATTTPPAGAAPAVGSYVYNIDTGPLRGTSFNATPGTTRSLTLPKLSLPQFKRRNRDKFTDPITVRKGSRNPTQQVTNWRAASELSTIPTKVDEIINRANATGGRNNQGMFFFRGNRNPQFNLIGTREQLLERGKIPFWDNDQSARTFQVDHIKEDQINGADDTTNYELLDASANMSSGSRLSNEINRRIGAAIDTLYNPTGTGARRPPGGKPNVDTVRNNYDVSFREHEFTLSVGGSPEKYWNLNALSRGNHLHMLRPLSGQDVTRLGDRSQPPAIFTSVNGGNRLPVPQNFPQNNWLPRVDLLNLQLNANAGLSDGVVGTMQVNAFRADGSSLGAPRGLVSSTVPQLNWNIMGIPGVYGGAIDRESLSNGMRSSLRLPGMSPIQINDVDLDGRRGFIARGKVLPTVPLIRDADIDIYISGNDVELRKTFSTGEMRVPPPFRLTDTSLSVFFSTSRGLGIEGQANFGIERLGEGFIRAAASTEGGFELEGEFNFETTLFNPARVGVTYRNGEWGLNGTVGIPEGRLRGVRSATINATYAQGIFRADGNAQLSIPGVRSGNVNIEVSDQGFTIGGTFELTNQIPGIRGGSVSVTVSKQSGDDQYHVNARGTAQPNIPGINSELIVAYEDGIFTLTGRASYNRGMLSGEVNVGVTNRPIGAEGNPAGEPDETMRVYGGGSLTVRIAPWLQATASVSFLENGEIEVQGELGIPSSIELFRPYTFNRTLFRWPTTEIPLFAIPLGPRSIGIVATVGGALEANAQIGPGTLEDAAIGVTYNPAHEENTTIHGTARFVIPASAGLRLSVRAGVGMSLAIARVSGNIELGGTLGLEGAAEANADVNWSPATGIELNAEGHVFVQPKFKFDVSAVLEASALFLSKEWRKTLAEFEYGPDLRFGVRFPVHYKEGEPFNISLDDLQFEYPDINIGEFSSGIGRRLF
jgi:hypothetical protein